MPWLYQEKYCKMHDITFECPYISILKDNLMNIQKKNTWQRSEKILLFEECKSNNQAILRSKNFCNQIVSMKKRFDSFFLQIMSFLALSIDKC